MVQKNKEKVVKTIIGMKEVRTTKVKVLQGGRKAAPKKRKINPVDMKVSNAINKNIEKLMAARVAHEGGHLSLVKAPTNVTEYVKSGPKMSQLQTKLRAGQNASRKRKADEHNALKQKDVDEEVTRLERLQARKERERVPMKRKGPLITVDAPDLADDDVAGPFFNEEYAEILGVPVEDVIAKPRSASVKSAPNKGDSKSKSMPARRAGFKGVHTAKAAAVLEEGF